MLKNRFKNLPVIMQILLPTLLGLLFFAVFTHVVFSGGKRESLAAFAEGYFIEMALRYAAEPAVDKGEVVTVSLTDRDLFFVERADLQNLRDADITVYAQIIKKLASYSPKMIVVNWLSSVQYGTEKKLAPLANVLDETGMKENVLVAFPYEFYNLLPKKFVNYYRAVQSVDCIYEVNRFCSIMPGWDRWMIQILAERFWKEIPSLHLSYNLPHYKPNFLANVPLRDSIEDFSFMEVLADKVSVDTFRDKVVFVGSRTNQQEQFKDNKKILQRTYTSATVPRRNLMADGLPYHQFWAGLTQMFIEGRTVAVMPRTGSWLILFFLCVFMIFVLVKFGAFATLITYVVVALGTPVLNGVTLMYFKFYTPMFPAIFGGMICLTIAAFVQISITNYRQWRLEAMQRAYDANTDLKVNFISLISHNLNTPLAKLWGLANLLNNLVKSDKEQPKLISLTRNITRLQLVVRCVLELTKQVHDERSKLLPVNFKTFVTNFVNDYESIIRRLGITLQLEPEIEDLDESILFSRPMINPGFLALAIAAMLAIFRDKSGESAFLGFNISSEGVDQNFFLIRAIVGVENVSVRELEQINNYSESGTSEKTSLRFYNEVFVKFLHTVAVQHDGSFSVTKYHRHIEIDLKLGHKDEGEEVSMDEQNLKNEMNRTKF